MREDYGLDLSTRQTAVRGWDTHPCNFLDGIAVRFVASSDPRCCSSGFSRRKPSFLTGIISARALWLINNPHQVLPLSSYQISVENIPLQPTESHHGAGTRERAKSLDLSPSPWLQLAALLFLQHSISCGNHLRRI